MTIEAIPVEPVSADLVDMLETLLAKAKRGELSSAAVATVNREGITGSAWSKAYSTGTLVGAVATLQHRMITRFEEE